MGIAALLSIPLMLLAGLFLDGATNDDHADDDPRQPEAPESGTGEPII